MSLRTLTLRDAMVHPKSGFTLEQALALANNYQLINQEPPVESLEEARDIVASLRANSGFNWITGEHALCVLELAMDSHSQVAAPPVAPGGWQA